MSDAEIRDILVKLAILEQRIHASSLALELQAKEYERRLDDLNNAHARAERTLATYMPRELVERRWDDLDTWRSLIDKELAKNQGRSAMLTAGVASLIAIGSFIVTILNYLANSGGH